MAGLLESPVFGAVVIVVLAVIFLIARTRNR